VVNRKLRSLLLEQSDGSEVSHHIVELSLIIITDVIVDVTLVDRWVGVVVTYWRQAEKVPFKRRKRSHYVTLINRLINQSIYTAPKFEKSY